MAPYQTKIKRARFVVGPFSAEQMEGIGIVFLDSMANRIKRGVNVNDAPSKALNPRYAKRKTGKGLQPIRDWTLTGRTMRSLKVKSVSENRGVIGFVDPVADTRAHFNNLRDRAFGAAPSDQKVLIAAVHETAKQARVVRVVKVA